MNANRFLAGLFVLTIAVLSACQAEEDTTQNTVSKTYDVSFRRLEDVVPLWNVGDQLYFADDASTKPGTRVVATSSVLSQDMTTLTATFRSVSPDAARVYAICSDDAWIRGWKSTFSFVYDGGLAHSVAAVGQADVNDATIELAPLTAIARFSLSLPGVSSVRIASPANIFPKKMTYDFKAGKTQSVSGQSSVVVKTDGAGEYYFPVIPGQKMSGTSIDLCNDAGLVMNTVEVTDDALAVAGEMISLGRLDEDVEDIINPDIPQSETVSEAIRKMGVGLSLCTTYEELPYEGYQVDRNDPLTYERMYNAEVLPITFETFYKAGFRSVRIPVTWFLHMDDTGSDIDEVWMKHIEKVVGMALDAGLYCIINVHHDTGTRSQQGSWLYADWKNYETISADFKNIWEQIALRFRDYDYRLLFEGYNEILDETKRWFDPTTSDGYTAANALNQDFVNVVRRTGGRNASRNLLVTTYSASTWEKALKSFVMPMDILPDHLAVQVHSYLPAKFVTANADHREEFYESDIAEIDAMFALVKTHILDKGYPCVLGEYGAYPRKNADGSLNTPHDIHRGRHAAVYTRKCLELGIAPIYWYNPMANYHFKWGHWTFVPVKDSLIKAYNEHVESLK